MGPADMAYAEQIRARRALDEVADVKVSERPPHFHINSPLAVEELGGAHTHGHVRERRAVAHARESARAVQLRVERSLGCECEEPRAIDLGVE